METLDNINTHNIENKKYKTYLLGTVGDLENCQKILLYKYSGPNDKPSLDKINSGSILESIKTSITIIKRNNKFSYNTSNLSSGFNVILYLDYLDKPIGYTEFIETKGIIPEVLTIELYFEVDVSNVENNLVIVVDNGLSSITKNKKDSKINRFLQSSDKLYGLTNIDMVNTIGLGQKKYNYPRYTKRVSELLKHQNEHIYLDYGICSFDGFYKLDLIKEMTIAEDLTNHQLGYYRGEIVLYSWKEHESGFDYTINSISRKDKFGNSINYTKNTIVSVSNDKYEKASVRYFSGKYISVILSNSGNNDITTLGIYNMDTKTWINLYDDSNNHVMDLWGIDSQIIELPGVKKLSKDSILGFCPEIINTQLDIRNYNYSVDLVKKIGDWYVLNQVRSDLDNNRFNFKVYTNLTKTIILSDSGNYVDQEPIIINNNILALRTTDISKGLDYYTYFIGEGTYYSENAYTTIHNLRNFEKSFLIYPNEETTSNNIQELSNSFGISISSVSENLSNYGTNMLIDHIGGDIIGSFLFGFRKYTCPEDMKIPKLIGSINGLIYYETNDNKIKLL